MCKLGYLFLKICSNFAGSISRLPCVVSCLHCHDAIIAKSCEHYSLSLGAVWEASRQCKLDLTAHGKEERRARQGRACRWMRKGWVEGG